MEQSLSIRLLTGHSCICYHVLILIYFVRAMCMGEPCPVLRQSRSNVAAETKVRTSSDDAVYPNA